MRLGFIVLLGLVGAGTAFADETVRTGAAAFGDWRTDAPGVRRLITPADLPAPFATRSSERICRRSAARTDAEIPKAPPGFAVDLFATGLSMPRVIRIAPNGDIFVAETGAGRVLVFRPGGVSAPVQLKARSSPDGLQQPYGIAFYPSGQEPRFVYVATPDSVVRFPYRSGETKTSGPPETIASLPGGGSHWTRDLAFSPDDKTLFVSVGSEQQRRRRRAESRMRPRLPRRRSAPRFGDEQRRADVLAFDPEGRNERVYATGIRNCSGLAIEPGTGALWCAVNERDGLGDDLPPDYVTHVSRRAPSMAGPGTISATIRIRATKASAPTLRTASRRLTFSFRRIRRRSASPSIRRISFPPNIQATPSSLCTARGIARSAPAIKSCAS